MASRDYIVNYDIRVATGNSLSELQKLVQPIQEMQSGLVALTSAIKEFNLTVNNLKTVADKMSFKPQVDLTGYRDALASMEVNARETAMRIRNVMERTLVGSRKDFEKSVGMLGANNYKEATAGFDRDISSLKSKLQLIEDVKTKIRSSVDEKRLSASARLDEWSLSHSKLDPFRTIADELNLKGYGNILTKNKDKGVWEISDTGKFNDFKKSYEHQLSILEELQQRHVKATEGRAKAFDATMAPLNENKGFSSILGVSGDELQKQAEAFAKIKETFGNIPEGGMKIDIGMKLTGMETMKTELETKVSQLQELANKRSIIIKSLYEDLPQQKTTTVKPPMPAPPKGMTQDYMFRDDKRMFNNQDIMSGRTGWNAEEIERLRQRYEKNVKLRNQYAQQLRAWRNDPGTTITEPARVPMVVVPQIDASKIEGEINSTFSKLTSLAKERSISIPINVAPDKDAAQTLLKGIQDLQKIANNANVKVKISIDSTATGKGGAAAINVSELQKLANQTPIRLRATLSNNSSGFDLNQSLMRIQKLADKHPILLRATLGANNSGFDLNQSLTRLRNLAKQHPIALRAIFNGSEAAFELQQSIARLQKLADGKPITLKAVLKMTKAEMAAQAKKFNPTINAKVNLVWGGPTEKANQLKNMQSKLPALKVTLNVTEAEAAINKLVAKIKSVNPVAMATGAATTGAASGGSGGGGRNAVSTPKVADSSKSRWYTLLGNTSYGANTPVAVDMFKGMGVMYGVGGAMGVMTDAFTQAVQYQNTMETAKSILKDNYTGKNFLGEYDAMAKQAREVAVKTKFTASQTADAVRFMSMAGLDMSTIKSSIAPIADIAVIGDNDLGEVADKMTNIQTAFKIQPNDMRKVADMLAKTFTSTNTDMMMLAESMEYAAPMASMANWKKGPTGSLAEALAMIGIMGNSGVQASMAGTTTRMMYQNILKTTKDQRKYWDALGIKLRDSDGSPRNMIDLLTDLSKKLDIKSDAGKAVLPGMMANLFRVTAGPGAAAVVQNIDKVRALAEANKTVEGNSAMISAAKQNTIQGMWHQVTSTFTEGIVKVFEQNDFQTYLREKLGELKNYFASPEFVQSLKTVMEMVRDLVGVFEKFAKIWISIYENFGGLAKKLIIFQAAATQFGYLIKPFAQVFNLAKSFIGPERVASMLAPNAISAVAYQKLWKERAMLGMASRKMKNKIDAYNDVTKNIDWGADYFSDIHDMYDHTIIAQHENLKKLKEAQLRNPELIERAIRMRKITTKQAILSGFKSSYKAFSVASMFATIKSTFLSVVMAVAKAFGALISPIGLAVTAITGLGWLIYNFTEKRKKANNEFQKLAEKNKEAVDAISNSLLNIKSPTLSNTSQKAINDITGKAEEVAKPRSRYKINPMLRNTVGISDVFKHDGVGSDLYIRKMYEQHINPMSKYLFGSEYKSYDDYYWGLYNQGKDVSEETEKYAQKAAALQMAFKSPEFERANKEYQQIITKWLATPENERKESVTDIYLKIIKIADRFSGWLRKDLPKLEDYDNIGNIRVNDVFNTYEAQKAMWKYFSDMGIVNPESPLAQEFALQRIKSGDRTYKYYDTVLSNITIPFRDSANKIHQVALQFKDGRPVWSSMLDELQKYNIKFNDNELEKQNILRILADRLADLPGMSDIISKFGDANDYLFAIVHHLDPDFAAAAGRQTRDFASAGNLAPALEAEKEMEQYFGSKDNTNKSIFELSKKNVFGWGENSILGGSLKDNNAVVGALRIRDAAISVIGEQSGNTQKNDDKKGDDLKLNDSKNGKSTTEGTGTGTGTGTGKRSPFADLTDQSDYKNRYARQGARPTQIIINIDKLANFDKSQFLTADQKTMANTLQQDIAQAVAMAFAQVAPQFNAFASNELG